MCVRRFPLVLLEHPSDLIDITCPGQRQHQKNASLLRIERVGGDHSKSVVLFLVSSQPNDTVRVVDGTQLKALQQAACFAPDPLRHRQQAPALRVATLEVFAGPVKHRSVVQPSNVSC